MNNNNHQAGNSVPSHVRSSSTDANDFLKRMKGKGPRESLDETAPSRLGWAFVQATLGCVILMAALTVGPYLYSQVSASDGKKAVKAPESSDKPDAAKADPKTPETPKTGDKSGTTTADNKKDKGVPSKDIVDKLKENETKPGTPKDPFGTGLDDLLDKK